MKYSVYALSVFVLILSACSHYNETPVKKKVDFTKEAIAIMDTISPQLIGSWALMQLDVKPTNRTSEIGIRKDTVLRNIAVLNILRVDRTGFKEQYPIVTGILRFRSKAYEVGFNMLATGNRITTKKGPHVFGLFEFRPSVLGTRPTEEEESYLWNLTLVGNNYSMEISPDGKTMVWKGLNGAVKTMQLVKR
jgi:hypothetical protein